MKALLSPLIALSFLISASPRETRHVKVEYSMAIKATPQMNQMSAELRKALLEPVYYTLENNGMESLYYFTNASDRQGQTIPSESKNKTTSFALQRTPPPVVYKNFESSTISTRTEIETKAYLTEADFSENTWKIQPETATIAGMQCRRATKVIEKTGGELEAWFAPEIPLYDGPAGYYGLPGLILKIESPTNTIYATRISYPGELKIQKPEGELISRDELSKIQEKTREKNRKEPETVEERDGNTIRRTTRSEVIRLN